MPEPQPPIISRAQWGAQPPKGTPIVVPWSQRTGVAIHHSAGPQSQTPAEIQRFHMDTNGWSDIGYNALVGEPGVLYIGRGFEIRGTHSAGENTSHDAVCYIGNTDIVTPSPAALSAIKWFYEECCRRAGRTLSRSGHGQLPGEATACPGDRLEIWIANGMPTGGGGNMELDSQLNGMEPRTVNDALTGALQLRNWLVNNPGTAGQGFPPPSSRGAALVDAALAILDGALVDAQAVADALAANEAFRQSIIDGVVAGIVQQPLNVSLEVSGTATGTATPAE